MGCSYGQRERHYNKVFSDAVAITVSHFSNSDAAIYGRLQIGMVGTDTGSHYHLQIFGFGDALSRHVGWPERLGDDDFSVM
jgi:hypothetical protein